MQTETRPGAEAALVPVTGENWVDVVFLTTNEDGNPTFLDGYVGCNAFTLAQAHYEKGWEVRIIMAGGLAVGLTMFGFCAREGVYEFCRMMIDRRYQGKGLGSKAARLVMEELVPLAGGEDIYSSSNPENAAEIHLLESLGFVPTGKLHEGEDVYCFHV